MNQGPARELANVLEELRAKQRNAAYRGKPLMWAYYLTVRRRLERWFTARKSNGAVAGQALALAQIAQRKLNKKPSEIAFWWAAGVYARRILRAWGVPEPKQFRPSLDWLRARADED